MLPSFTVTVKYLNDTRISFPGCDTERMDNLIQNIETDKIDFFKVTREG